MKRYVIFLIVLFFVSCGRWKVSGLKPYKLCELNNGSEPGELAITYGDDQLLNLTFNIRVHQGNIFILDNVLNRIQILEKDGSPLHIIGIKDRKSLLDEDVIFSHFQFSILGSLTVDSKGNIYVQNRFKPSRKSRKNRNRGLDFSPSYILVFNKNGNLQYTLGQKGSPDFPFYYIENQEIDNKDRLFIISRSFDKWSVFRFNKRKRDFYINLGEIAFKETENDEVYIGRIENIKIYQSGLKFLIAVAYYHNADFKYRKIYVYSIKDRMIENTILNIPDPNNELFTMINDKHIYLWDVDNKTIKFIICNTKGDIINNILLKIPKKNASFENIFIDELGKFYTFHVMKKSVEMFGWK